MKTRIIFVVIAILTVTAVRLIGFSTYTATAQTPASEGLIVFTRGSSHYSPDTEIYTIKPDGSDPKRLTYNSYQDWLPRISPDGSKIAFCSQPPTGSIFAVMDIDGGNMETITDQIPCLGRHYSWSPDSTKVAFLSGFKLYTIEIATGNISPVQSDATDDLDGGVDWSPDGNRFVLVLAKSWTLHVQDSDGSNLDLLSTLHPREPVWSPDGSKIAYEQYMGRLRIINRDGSNDTSISTSRSAFIPSWSPDGSQIAYATLYGGQLRIINSDGTNDHAIPNVPGGWVDGLHWGTVNSPPEVWAGGAYEDDEGATIALAGARASDPDNDTLTFSWHVNSPLCTFSDPDTLHPTLTCSDDGSFAATLTVDDGVHDPVSDDAIVTISNVAPAVDSLAVPLEPININDQILETVNVTFSDPAGINDEPYTCDFDLDNDGQYDVSVGGANGNSCSTLLNYAGPGIYTIKVTVTDKDGGSDSATATDFIVIYDPDGGFVTGGGWIDSPEGAYVADPSLTGKATFGFISRYKKGANVPTGETEFRFKVAGLDFYSDVYDMLVVAGAKAQYKGSGTINGEGPYKFLIQAADAAINDRDSFDVDRFRIKIWREAGETEVVIYDNGLGNAGDLVGTDDDQAIKDTTTAIGGGNIKVHKGK